MIIKEVGDGTAQTYMRGERLQTVIDRRRVLVFRRVHDRLFDPTGISQMPQHEPLRMGVVVPKHGGFSFFTCVSSSLSLPENMNHPPYPSDVGAGFVADQDETFGGSYVGPVERVDQLLELSESCAPYADHRDSDHLALVFQRVDAHALNVW